uniref:Uncharacterized protein n=1 Tax=Rhizophora mucronata TaxID=61149 RepID=A0A2P2KTW4_RHIMU
MRTYTVEIDKFMNYSNRRDGNGASDSSHLPTCGSALFVMGRLVTLIAGMGVGFELFYHMTLKPGSRASSSPQSY